MKASEILHPVDEYINKYKSEQTNKYETIYRVPASDASKMGLNLYVMTKHACLRPQSSNRRHK